MNVGPENMLLNVWERAPSQNVPDIIFDTTPESIITERIAFQKDGVTIGVLPVIKVP